MNDCDLIFGKPIEFISGVNINIPTVEDVVYFDNFNIYTSIFTITPREIFTTLRNVDELCEKYPNIWSIAHDEYADMQVGSYFHPEKTVSMIIMEALSYWTGLKLDGDDGFVKMSNGKIVHVGSEWIINFDEYKRFSDVIKKIICWSGIDEEMRAPKITSDVVHKQWLRLYEGKLKERKRRSYTMGDKILILSISTDSYIPIDEIKKMTIYTFNRIFSGLSAKDSSDKSFMLYSSPKFSGDRPPRSWKENWKNIK